MTTGSPPSSTATHEFVVPRSIPMTRPIYSSRLYTLPAPPLNLGKRLLGVGEIGVELERALKLLRGIVTAASRLRLAPARVTEQRAVLLRLRRSRREAVERLARRRPIL